VSDPITQLALDLDRYGKPSLEWVIRWSADGVDPVAAGWRVSGNQWAMRNVARRLVGEDRAHYCWEYPLCHSACGQCLETIRAACAPTLDAVLAAPPEAVIPW
jgi:hypothetical protein